LFSGLSRTLEGKIIPSERPNHFMMEVWNPLGLVGVITAFNFPCAVLGWNLAIAMVCGDLTVWKGASSTSLVTIATTKVIAEVLERNNLPEGVLTTIIGPGRSVGEQIINDKRLELISFTGSTSVIKPNLFSLKILKTKIIFAIRSEREFLRAFTPDSVEPSLS
jgi:aldehyde dehydrogenase family 7 member A1